MPIFKSLLVVHVLAYQDTFLSISMLTVVVLYEAWLRVNCAFSPSVVSACHKAFGVRGAEWEHE